MKARNYTNNRAWLLLLLIWPLAGAVTLTGCKREDAIAQERAASPAAPYYYGDPVTGCEYVSSGGRGITPRIATDGKTHMGCKGVRP